MLSVSGSDTDLPLFKCARCPTDLYFITAEGLAYHSILQHGNEMRLNETEQNNSNTAGRGRIDIIDSDSEHIGKANPIEIPVDSPTYDPTLVAEEASPEHATDEDNSKKYFVEYRKNQSIDTSLCYVCGFKFDNQDDLINHLYQSHIPKEYKSVGTETVPPEDRMHMNNAQIDTHNDDDYIFFTFHDNVLME